MPLINEFLERFLTKSPVQLEYYKLVHLTKPLKNKLDQNSGHKDQGTVVQSIVSSSSLEVKSKYNI